MKFKKTAAALAATGLVALAGPAMAAGPYQVDVGTNTTGSFAFTGATSSGINFVVDGNSGPINMTCTSATASGTIVAGANATGNGVANITGTTWSGCTGLGLNLSVTHSGTWKLNATGTATAAATDNVAGNVGSVAASVAAPFGACSFTVAGKVNGAYKEATKELAVNESGFTGNLSVGSTVTGCLGLISPGAAADFVGTFNITSPSGTPNIK